MAVTCTGGPCVGQPWDLVPYACFQHVPTPPSPCGGADRLDVYQQPRFSCPSENQRISALLQVQTCCDAPSCPIDTSPCGVIAKTYDSSDTLIAQYCMEQVNISYPYPYELITDCVFDRWTVPKYWIVMRNGTPWRLRCGASGGSLLKYACCTGPQCTRQYQN